ncbi:carbohydrate-binding family 9-like protein [Chryseolinea sp. T2]|uniref:carbohydrate-binding family 9-like protein n=1 Tax=Chryseolinea sp. T2 TaxID=3129255 RepID=UPI003078352D
MKRIEKQVVIDGNWNKRPWKDIPSVKVENRMGDEPRFTPVTEAKACYDSANIYVIFRVEDKFVKSTVTEYNGNVSGDSCVEFFFSPDTTHPDHYFNLEINAGGTPLIFFITKPWTEVLRLPDDAIRQIEIAHSLPKVVDPEIQKPVTWTIEYRIPIRMLRQFANVTLPKAGVVWPANFYKTGSKTSNPHYYTWSPVSNPVPNFHLPEYFGRIAFK